MSIENHIQYNPEPSETLSQKGDVVKGSYFLADGVLFLANNKNIDCHFEVAHMRNGMSWCVVYIVFPRGKNDDNAHFGQKENLVKDVETATKLHGKERLWERDIDITLFVWGGRTGNATSTGLRLIYMVSEYSVSVAAPYPTSYVMFSLANLPISKKYDLENIRDRKESEFYESMNNSALVEAIKKVIHSSISQELTEEDLIKLGIEEANNIKNSLRDNSPKISNEFIPIKIGNVVIAKLFWLKNTEEQTYPSEPLSRLLVDQTKVPLGWDLATIADWICNLLSLALGRMIICNYSFIPSHERNGLNAKETWVSRILQTDNFQVFTDKPNELVRFGLENDSYSIIFVQDALTYLFNYSTDQTEKYLSALYDYVYYASTPGDDQHRSILLCVIVESLFAAWKMHTAPSIEAEILKPVRIKIIDAIQVEIEKLLLTVLPKEANETQEMYDNRQKKFLERLRSTIGNNLSDSFPHRLKSLFGQYGWQTDHPSDAMNTKILSFVGSRNKLFHEHRFASDDPKQFLNPTHLESQINSEIQNIQLFVPLMFATILQFKGRYWDSITNNWSWMPNPISESQITS